MRHAALWDAKARQETPIFRSCFAGSDPTPGQTALNRFRLANNAKTSQILAARRGHPPNVGECRRVLFHKSDEKLAAASRTQRQQGAQEESKCSKL
jgi:hypothetical protein